MNKYLSITFGGVRGSLPCTDADQQQFGGNTISLEISASGEKMIIDLGTGARYLGQKLNIDQNCQSFPVFFSHLHLDHIMGMPFFAPLYNSKMAVSFYSACKHFGHGPLKEKLHQFCAPPFFPIRLEDMAGVADFHDFVPGDVLSPIKDTKIATISIPHPNGSVGFRIEHAEKSIGVLCDMMPFDRNNSGIFDFMQGVDLLVIDGAFTEEQYATRQDWGHCSWNYTLEVARSVGMPELYIIHHDILNNDQTLLEMEAEARRLYPNVTFGREGMTATL